MLLRYLNDMWKLFSSLQEDPHKTKSVIVRQKKLVRTIWNGKHYNDFGIERLVRLFLAIMPFTDLGLYLRNCFQGEGKGLHRKLFTDLYVIVNMFLPYIVLFGGCCDTWLFWICLYLGIETMCALLSMTFLTPDIPTPVSHRRNFILLFFNFMQFVALFAVIYIRYGVVLSLETSWYIGPLKALYLSLETFSTVGFGDIVPNNGTGYFILICQMIVILLFIYVFFATFTSKMGNSTYFNKKS